MHQTQVKRSTSSSETTVASTDKNEPNIWNINENMRYLSKENKGKEEASRKLEDSEKINSTINTSNVYNKPNALATINTTEQKKVDMVNKQMETRTEQQLQD